jgi:hypothetical protein
LYSQVSSFVLGGRFAGIIRALSLSQRKKAQPLLVSRLHITTAQLLLKRSGDACPQIPEDRTGHCNEDTFVTWMCRVNMPLPCISISASTTRLIVAIKTVFTQKKKGGHFRPKVPGNLSHGRNQKFGEVIYYTATFSASTSLGYCLVAWSQQAPNMS